MVEVDIIRNKDMVEVDTIRNKNMVEMDTIRKIQLGLKTDQW